MGTCLIADVRQQDPIGFANDRHMYICEYLAGYSPILSQICGPLNFVVPQ